MGVILRKFLEAEGVAIVNPTHVGVILRKVLSEIKTEFITYQDTVEKVYKDMNRVNTDFENLVRTRTNQMNKKLNKIETIECSEDDNITK